MAMLQRRFWCFGFLISFFAGLLSIPSGVAAQNAKEQAKKHYAQGQKFFDEGRFAEAEASFQRAHDVSPHPIVLLSIAESRVGQGNFVGAVTAFERYLKESPGAKDKAKIEARIREIKAKPGKLAIRSAPAGAKITVDGEPVTGTTPTSVELTPGLHEVVFSLDDHHSVTKRIDVAYGSNEVVKVDLRPIEPDTISDLEDSIQEDTEVEVEEESGSSGVPTGALVAGGVGAAGLISGVIFGLLALDAESEFEMTPTEDTADKGEAYALIADISYGVAIVGAATAIILWATADEDAESVEVEKEVDVETEDEWSELTVTPTVSPNYAGVHTSLTF